jgi:hypothetical protein
MAKSIFYTESKELLSIAEKLRIKYLNILGYIDLDKIFFSFKGGDGVPEWFKYEMMGIQNDWLKFTHHDLEDSKLYCLAMTYDFFEKSQGGLLEWTLLDLLYNCANTMNGQLRKKDVHEYSRILSTLEDIDCSYDWRENAHLPSLLESETIAFGVEKF